MTVDKKEEAAFLAAFDGTEPEPTPEPVSEAEPVEEVATDAVEPKAEQEEVVAEAEKPEEDDSPRIAGFTQEELRNLLSRVAKLDEVEAGLRKAHGKIGELNGSLQELRTKAPAEKKPEQAETTNHVEEDYPDIAAWVRAQLDQRAPAVQAQQEQAPQPVQADSTPDVQLALMDHLNEGWREKVQTRDFNLWLASQGDDIRTKYDTAETAKELSSVISQFDAWTTGKETRSNKGKQRLEQALTPEGGAGKPKTAPTPEEAFLAAFHNRE